MANTNPKLPRGFYCSAATKQRISARAAALRSQGNAKRLSNFRIQAICNDARFGNRDYVFLEVASRTSILWGEIRRSHLTTQALRYRLDMVDRTRPVSLETVYLRAPTLEPHLLASSPALTPAQEAEHNLLVEWGLEERTREETLTRDLQAARNFTTALLSQKEKHLEALRAYEKELRDLKKKLRESESESTTNKRKRDDEQAPEEVETPWSCPFCLEAFVAGKDSTMISHSSSACGGRTCSAFFHLECLLRWIEVSNAGLPISDPFLEQDDRNEDDLTMEAIAERERVRNVRYKCPCCNAVCRLYSSEAPHRVLLDETDVVAETTRAYALADREDPFGQHAGHLNDPEGIPSSSSSSGASDSGDEEEGDESDGSPNAKRMRIEEKLIKGIPLSIYEAHLTEDPAKEKKGEVMLIPKCDKCHRTMILKESTVAYYKPFLTCSNWGRGEGKCDTKSRSITAPVMRLIEAEGKAWKEARAASATTTSSSSSSSSSSPSASPPSSPAAEDLEGSSSPEV
jgi:hypothetical protein